MGRKHVRIPCVFVSQGLPVVCTLWNALSTVTAVTAAVDAAWRTERQGTVAIAPQHRHEAMQRVLHEWRLRCSGFRAKITLHKVQSSSLLAGCRSSAASTAARVEASL